jgi:hypothetical protein
MRSRKIIKKITKLTVILLLMVIALQASAILLLQSSSIQTALANRFMKIVSEKLNTRFSISSIDISFLYRVRIKDVYLQDLNGDTLIYAESLTAGFRYINPIRREISIGSLNFNKASLALAIDSAGDLNLNYFLDKLRGNGQKKGGGWSILFNNIKLHDSRFSLRNNDYRPTEFGMNYTDLRAYAIDADVKRFSPKKDSLSFYIKSLQLKEQCGFTIDKLKGEFSQSKKFICFRKVTLKTPQSNIQGDEISLRFNGYSKFKADSFSRFVKLRVNLTGTELNLRDVGYFAPSFRYADQMVRISGKVDGPLSNLKGKDLDVQFGNNSHFMGELNLEGLPDYHVTFIMAHVKGLTTSADDLRKLQLPGQNRIKVPEIVNKFGLINYKGNFTGFINDFVAYGRFDTELGVIKTDLLFRPDSSSLLAFEGQLQVEAFDLGTFLNGSKDIGKISLNASVDGSTLAGKSIHASMKGMVQQFEFRKYNYTNIDIAGNLKDKDFNGSVNVHDPNIDLEFMGNIDLSDTVPAFNFTANITDANLYALNISKSDPNLRASCYLIADAQGNSVNSLNGEVKLLNSLFISEDKQLQIYDLSIITVNKAGNNRLQLRSDFLDADMNGNYLLTETGNSIKKFLFSYLPSLSDSAHPEVLPFQHNISFNATIKNIKPVLDFFMPNYEIAEKSTLNFSYTPENKTLNLHFQAPWIAAKGIAWNNLNLTLNGTNNLLELEAGGSKLSLNDRITLDNFTVYANSASDTASILIRWNNWQDLEYKGTISALAKVSHNAGQPHPHIEISMRPTNVVTRDTVWAIQPGKVSIDSSSIKFEHIAVDHRNEYFSFNGAISQDPDDEMNILFNNFNLSNLNGITSGSGVMLGGILDGKATFTNVYNNILFTSLLNIDSLKINNEMLGNTDISSKWDNIKKAIEINAHAMRDNLKTIDISGEYLPEDAGRLNFDLALNKLQMNLFNPYVKSVFSNIKGLATGKATLTGTASKPLLNGEIDLQNTSCTVNYLQTKYNFSDKVQIENNSIYFNNIKIYDTEHHWAYLSGAIRNKYLRDFRFDLTIQAKNFMAMNTTQEQNQLFYGTAFATGIIKIYGPLKNMNMDITAKSEKDTKIFFPLTNTGKLDAYPFINIVSPQENTIKSYNEKQPAYQVNLSSMQINMNLEVTPDAEVQIIFDPKMGDKIKGTGKGNFDIKVNTSGSYSMFGDFTIEKGNYLFTSQNFINRDFTIESGGTIKWNGDPLDATLNMVAYYKTKASLNDLYGNQDETNSQRIWVQDRITMTGKLTSPELKFDIKLPDADESTQINLNSAIASTEELNKQFISLLIMNRFLPSTNRSGTTQTSGTPYSSVAGVNASEFFSNQMSHMLSQIFNDVDVNFSYRPDRELKSDELQLALSYQMFNNRLTINGSVDMVTNATASTSDEIVGEFDVDYKLKPNGKLRLKTYNHANNDMLYENSTYTQGLGISYKEDFNNLKEVWDRMFKPSAKKEEEIKPVTPDIQDSTVNN